MYLIIHPLITPGLLIIEQKAEFQCRIYFFFQDLFSVRGFSDGTFICVFIVPL